MTEQLEKGENLLSLKKMVGHDKKSNTAYQHKHLKLQFQG